MTDQQILVIDAGTTSTRAVLYAADGAKLDAAQRPIRSHYPESGWVEQDAEEIWQETLACLRDVVGRVETPSAIAALGITNQRETVIFWDRRSGAALGPAIVWQDRRTAEICGELAAAGHEALVTATTGLRLDPYFSASKIGWALKHWPALREARDNLAVGTVESWLVHRLTGGLHISDASNASRTALMDIEAPLGRGAWDDRMTTLFGVPKSILPEIVSNSERFDEIDRAHFGLALPICGMAGDQQAATIGQGCLKPGHCKATYGTGAFILSVTGIRRHSDQRLLSTIGWDVGGERHFALEGSIFVAGSLIQWLRDQMGLLKTAPDSAALAASVPDNGGVCLVPAMTGLGAPHWRPEVRGMLSGLSFGAGPAHIVRAALEAMAHQTDDLAACFAADGAEWRELRIDGGMAGNDWMAQDLADLLELPVLRPEDVETTARGAAMLAAVGAGIHANLEAAADAMLSPLSRFENRMAQSERERRRSGWAKAVAMLLT